MNVKKIVTLAVVALIVFYILTHPTQSADAAHTVIGWLEDGATAIIQFIKELFS